jgi:DNA segregation ATPase FtsK/SpoIIIE, S-DNA-T family
MKKLFDKITKDSYFLKGTIGLMLCLFAIFGALNRGYVSGFITWIIAFLFGWFFYVFYLIIFLVGIRLIFAKKEFKFQWGITIAGLIVILVGSLILATNNITGSSNDEMLTFKNFGEEFSKSIQGFPILNYSQISGGFFGFLLVALLNSVVKYVGTNIIGGLLLAVGIVLILVKPSIRLIKKIKEYKNRNIKKMESEFKEANDQTAFTTTQIIENTRATTVITPDAEIAKENTQSIAIQNPNGGVGVGLTSINRAPTGLKKAKFTSDSLYETEEQTTTLEEKYSISSPVEQKDPRYGDTTHIEKDEIVKNDDIPVAKPASFKEHQSLSDEKIKLAQTPYEKLDGADINDSKNNIKSSPTKPIKYNYPQLNLLTDRASNMNSPENLEVCEARKDLLNEVFDEFEIHGRVVSYTIGPVVTRYDIEMDRGESSKNIEKYLNDIAAKLGGISCRFVSVIEGKTTSGLEIANKKGSLVNFKDCLKNLSRDPGTEFLIPFGKDINGRFIQGDLKDFPHLLVCGTTGSGKSVFMHSLLMTLIMRNNLDTLKLVIIDPKRVEFNKYKNIPFLLCNPINAADEACLVLNELCKVMEERYDLFDETGVENLKQYNKYLVDHGKRTLPRIVVLVDEYADLVGENKHLQAPVQRLAQKARAAGIHLVVATQRPSVNVITGVIKSNIPTRVALLCSSVNDSTVILSQGGAEKLLGNGDMLVMSPLLSKNGLTRVQGSYVDNAEIKNVCDYLRNNYGAMFDERFVDLKEKSQLDNTEMQEVSYDKAASDEEKYKQIREDIMKREYASLSYIQRTYAVGFPKAGKIINRLINEGVISSENEGNKGQKVLIHSITPEERTGSVEQSTFVPNKNDD